MVSDIRLGHRQGHRLSDAPRHRRDILDSLSSDEPITGLHRVEHPDLDGIDTAGSGKAIHLPLVGEARLDHTETPHRPTGKVVGADRVTVNHRVLTSIGALRVRHGVDQHRG